MKHKILCSTIFILSLAGAAKVEAALSPVGISLFSPLQFPPEDVTITGIRLNLLYGVHRKVYGFDLGVLGNITSNQFTGLLQASGLFNYNRDALNVVGLQLAGLANLNGARTSIFGLQASLFNSTQGESRLVGLGVGVLANATPHATVVGAQVGVYNSARRVYGFQFGLVNVADELMGFQIGLINIHRQGLFKVCPLINFGI